MGRTLSTNNTYEKAAAAWVYDKEADGGQKHGLNCSRVEIIKHCVFCSLQSRHSNLLMKSREDTELAATGRVRAYSMFFIILYRFASATCETLNKPKRRFGSF